MFKTVLVILALFIVPGVIMGVISSYRAGQNLHWLAYLRLKKFAQCGKKV